MIDNIKDRQVWKQLITTVCTWLGPDPHSHAFVIGKFWVLITMIVEILVAWAHLEEMKP